MKYCNSPRSKVESSSFVRYSKLFGIFLSKLAAEVESNIISATSNGIPPGFGCRSRTSFLGNTCMCTSLLVSPEDVMTSTRMKSVSTDAFPQKVPASMIEKIFFSTFKQLKIKMRHKHKSSEMKLAINRTSSLRSKRFNGVKKQRNIEEWPGFLMSFLASQPHENACYAGYHVSFMFLAFFT